MKDTASFIKYSIKNASKINQLIKSKQPLADIAGRIAGLKNRAAAERGSIHQKKIANIAFFFSLLFPTLRQRRCFFSSLLIMQWAYSRGLTPKLNIGLRKKTGEMEGHAWLSIDGTPFCERSTLPENYTIKLSETSELIYWYDEENKPGKPERGDIV
jgi:hypothetical protein